MVRNTYLLGGSLATREVRELPALSSMEWPASSDPDFVELSSPGQRTFTTCPLRLCAWTMGSRDSLWVLFPPRHFRNGKKSIWFSAGKSREHSAVAPHSLQVSILETEGESSPTLECCQCHRSVLLRGCTSYQTHLKPSSSPAPPPTAITEMQPWAGREGGVGEVPYGICWPRPAG